MKIGIVHDIHDPEAFQERGEPGLNPENADVRQFCPAEDGSVATCVWEADSVENVRNYTDTPLGDASTRTYFPISEEGGIRRSRVIRLGGIPTYGCDRRPVRCQRQYETPTRQP